MCDLKKSMCELIGEFMRCWMRDWWKRLNELEGMLLLPMRWDIRRRFIIFGGGVHLGNCKDCFCGLRGGMRGGSWLGFVRSRMFCGRNLICLSGCVSNN